MRTSPSRIQEARRRATGAKQAAVGVAAAGFLALVLLARASHPASAPATAGSTSDSSTTLQFDDDGGFDLSPGSVSPSDGSQPGAQSSVS
ncbi:MAG: hypothetical protein ABW245_08060 [Gaiellaceae bacterium]